MGAEVASSPTTTTPTPTPTTSSSIFERKLAAVAAVVRLCADDAVEATEFACIAADYDFNNNANDGNCEDDDVVEDVRKKSKVTAGKKKKRSTSECTTRTTSSRSGAVLRSFSETVLVEVVTRASLKPSLSVSNLLRRLVDRTSDVVSFGRRGRRRAMVLVAGVSDSLLGTSLRDELLDATQPTSLSSFDQETPLFVMPPMIMGNSLAAIGARNQMTWESMSERSRLSSSSDSGGGPMMSFGQALRSAMEVGGRSSDGEESSDANIADETTSSTSRKSSVAVETTEKLSRIPREKGLDAQEFRCALCRKSIGGPAYAKFETCALDGMYYCVTCMNPGGTSPIPSRVIAGWDWKERRISDRGRAWIEAHQEKAVLNIDECNAQLYQRVASLEEVRLLREKLQIVSMYLFTCRDSVADDFRRRVWPKEYLHTDIHRYSFVDLLDVKSGALKKRLTLLLKHAAGHVMSCPLCRQKGFVCELCPIGDVIYPFDVEATHRCRVCFSVYHKPCWTTAPECPKCSRRAQFDARRALIDEPHSLLLLQP